MKSPALQVVRSQKQTIDSRDKSSQRVCAMLGKVTKMMVQSF